MSETDWNEEVEETDWNKESQYTDDENEVEDKKNEEETDWNKETDEEIIEEETTEEETREKPTEETRDEDTEEEETREEETTEEETREEERKKETNKLGIVVLTRGYEKKQDYKFLIMRNLSISKNLINKNIPLLIFHEGNIQENHQKYILNSTPELSIQFIDISKTAFQLSNIPSNIYNPTKLFNINYRHMCHFWFVDVWHYLKDYNKIIRIDEDCIIKFNIDNIFNKLTNLVAIYGKWVPEQEYVSHKLNDFTRETIKHIANLDKLPPATIQSSGPYTNVMGLNLDLLNKNEYFLKYVDIVKKSGNIYIYRWGDLPLMGEVLRYFYPQLHLIDKNIKYFHGSHQKYIN
jgi:hypothetical protein